MDQKKFSVLEDRAPIRSLIDQGEGGGHILQGYTKIILGLYLIHKRRNVKFKIYLEFSYFFCHLADFDRTPRPYIHIKSTPAGQQLPNLKCQ